MGDPNDAAFKRTQDGQGSSRDLCSASGVSQADMDLNRHITSNPFKVKNQSGYTNVLSVTETPEEQTTSNSHRSRPQGKMTHGHNTVGQKPTQRRASREKYTPQQEALAQLYGIAPDATQYNILPQGPAHTNWSQFRPTANVSPGSYPISTIGSSHLQTQRSPTDGPQDAQRSQMMHLLPGGQHSSAPGSAMYGMEWRGGYEYRFDGQRSYTPYVIANLTPQLAQAPSINNRSMIHHHVQQQLRQPHAAACNHICNSDCYSRMLQFHEKQLSPTPFPAHLQHDSQTNQPVPPMILLNPQKLPDSRIAHMTDTHGGGIPQFLSNVSVSPGHPFHGHSLHSRTQPSEYADPQIFANSRLNLYVKGLPADITEEKLHEICSKYGKIVSIRTCLGEDPVRGTMPYGFVMYSTENEAQHAMVSMREADGFEVNYARESFSEKLNNLQSLNDSNVYISNLPLELEEEVLLKNLRTCGSVLSCRVLRNPSGSSKGVAFARMATRQQGVMLIEKFNGHTIPEYPETIIQARFADNQMQKALKKKQQLKKMRQTNQELR